MEDELDLEAARNLPLPPPLESVNKDVRPGPESECQWKEAPSGSDNPRRTAQPNRKGLDGRPR